MQTAGSPCLVDVVNLRIPRAQAQLATKGTSVLEGRRRRFSWVVNLVSAPVGVRRFGKMDRQIARRVVGADGLLSLLPTRHSKCAN